MSPTRRRFAVAVAAVAFVLAGCGFTAPVTTPTTPMTYGWVMAHNWDAWGVQIGPKVDADGTHVAVYGWKDCTATSCDYEYFAEFDELVPGSVHDYSVYWIDDGWHLMYDGETLAVLNLGNPTEAKFQWKPDEQTTR